MINLVGNAVKFTFKGCVTIKVKNKSNINNNYSNCIQISISDTGVGIEKSL